MDPITLGIIVAIALITLLAPLSLSPWAVYQCWR